MAEHHIDIRVNGVSIYPEDRESACWPELLFEDVFDDDVIDDG